MRYHSKQKHDNLKRLSRVKGFVKVNSHNSSARAASDKVGTSSTPSVLAADKGDRLCNYLAMLGHASSDINQGALSAVLPFLVSGGYSYTQAVMLIFAANIVSAVIQPLFGWISDKRPCPWFMALGVLLAGVGMCGIGWAPSYGWIVASAVISGFGVAMFHAEGGRLSNLAAGVRKGNGMSIFAVGGNVGFFVGPIVAAVALTAFGMRGLAVFLVPSAACSALLLAHNRRMTALGSASASGSCASYQRERWGMFGLVMGVLSLRSLLSYGFMAFIPLFLMNVLGQTDAASSLAISLFSISGAFATVVSGRCSEAVGAHRLAIMSLAVTAVLATAFACNDTSVALAVALTALLSIGIDLFYPSTVAVGMSYVPRHLGTASGLCYGVAICVGGAAEPLLGIAGDAFGLTSVMLALAGCALVASVLSVVIKHLDAAHA